MSNPGIIPRRCSSFELKRELVQGPSTKVIFAEIWPELDAATHITMAEEKEASFRELADSKLEVGTSRDVTCHVIKAFRTLVVWSSSRPNTARYNKNVTCYADTDLKWNRMTWRATSARPIARHVI